MQEFSVLVFNHLFEHVRHLVIECHLLAVVELEVHLFWESRWLRPFHLVVTAIKATLVREGFTFRVYLLQALLGHAKSFTDLGTFRRSEFWYSSWWTARLVGSRLATSWWCVSKWFRLLTRWIYQIKVVMWIVYFLWCSCKLTLIIVLFSYRDCRIFWSPLLEPSSLRIKS